MPKSPPPSSSVNRLPSGNIELTIAVPRSRVQSAYEEVIDETVKAAEIKGFRKGHAPRNIVEARLDRNQTFSHALQHLLPKAYQAAVDQHHLKPVVYPQIRIEKGKEGEDWVFVATVCEIPTVDQRLVALAENLSSLGLTVDKYLAAKKLTRESLRAKLASQVKQDIIQAQYGQSQPVRRP